MKREKVKELYWNISMEFRLLASGQGLEGPLWQSPAWRTYQEALGREVRLYGLLEGTILRASASVIIDSTKGGLRTWDIPRGPLGPEQAAAMLTMRIREEAQRENALLLRLSPPIPLPLGPDFFPSRAHIQPEATRIVSLVPSEHEILAAMKPKGRYNIRVAERHAIEVRESTDTAAFHALLKRTGMRDRFGIHPESHYQTFLKHLPGAFLLLAYHPRTSATEPIAGLMGVQWQTTGIYYYGASDDRHRTVMAPYLLQWEAMKRCKAAGCTHYDLLGVAPPDAPSSHPWAGITTFKEKFGGDHVMYPPEQWIILRPMAWGLLQLKRRILG